MRPPPPDSNIDDGLSRGIRASLFFHGLVVVIAILTQVVDIGGSRADEREALRRAQMARNAIRVDMVDLPRMKPEELSQIDPTLEISKDPGPAPVAPKAPVPSKDAMVEPKKESKPTPQKDRIKDIRERLRADSRRKEMLAKLEGETKATSRGGRQALAGNQLSQGYSVTGDIAKDGDVYIGRVKTALMKNWAVPVWMTAANLKAHVVLRIAPDGRIIGKEFAKKSGNSEFDSYVERAIDGANPLPPPPESLRHAYLEDGLGYSFP